MEQKRVGLYMRVSTKEQTISNQALDLRKYAEARGWKIVVECADEGISGKQEERPALKTLMGMVRKRQIDIVLIHRLDRLFRSLKGLIRTTTEMAELNVALVSFSESIDLSSAQGRLTSSILGALGEFEACLIQERIMSGLRRARAEGKRLGRPAKPIDVEKARLLRSEGKTHSEIGKLLGVSREGIRKALQTTATQKGGHPPTETIA
jgi:DNA invertase Pin-like site-specific DNA recombinase